MKPLWRDVLIVVVALLLGGAGSLLLGASPAAVVPTALAEPDWVAPSMRRPIWRPRMPSGKRALPGERRPSRWKRHPRHLRRRRCRWASSVPRTEPRPSS